MCWDSLVETVGQMPGSQASLYHYLQVYYLPFCPYLLPQKLNHYQLYFPHTVVQKAKQENGCETPFGEMYYPQCMQMQMTIIFIEPLGSS